MIYSTAASVLIAKRPHECGEKISALKKRVEVNELHWDEIYGNIRKTLQALRMRDAKEKKKQENERPTFLSPESASSHLGSPNPLQETPSPTREDLRDEIRENLL